MFKRGLLELYNLLYNLYYYIIILYLTTYISHVIFGLFCLMILKVLNVTKSHVTKYRHFD